MNMKAAALVAACAFGVSIELTAASAAKREKIAVDFKNFTYNTNPCHENVPVPVVMRNGDFAYLDKKMGAEFDLYVQSVTEGSLRSGTRQAVVVLACDFPVGGTAAAYVFDERGGDATLLRKVATADWGADWGERPDSIHARFANHSLYVDECGDTKCSTGKRTVYALRGGKIVQLARRSGPLK
jgi:hypothetical protein